ncbi:cell number regulator 4-like [Patiria miniata]|uniref:Uncharacterized protein n=1 Tax=Patiria miniata TaxID=46514 RepID=A0A913ZKP5_PATMI|nr:cell number regulator 4-like [Patiria miniata]
MGEWDTPLFGCFGNLGMCVFSWFVPCYTHGKTAEAVGTGGCLPCALVIWILPCYTHGKTAELLGEDCMKCGLVFLVPCYNFYNLAKIRERVRARSNISGSFKNDCLLSVFCPPCVIIQHAHQMGTVTPLGGGQPMARA